MPMISKLHYITQGATPEQHLTCVQKACASGADWIQLRLKGFEEAVVLQTAFKARAITAHFQTRLLINDYYKVAKAVEADGVHLGKTDACPLEARKYLGNLFTIGGTANTLQDCVNLIAKKVDYIGLGPYKFTKTKKNLSPVIGLAGYKVITEELATEIPIIAIGGITIEDVPELIKTGVHGIALSKEITNDFNRIQELSRLLQMGSTQEQQFEMK